MRIPMNVSLYDVFGNQRCDLILLSLVASINWTRFIPSNMHLHKNNKANAEEDAGEVPPPTNPRTSRILYIHPVYVCVFDCARFLRW